MTTISRTERKVTVRLIESGRLHNFRNIAETIAKKISNGEYANGRNELY